MNVPDVGLALKLFVMMILWILSLCFSALPFAIARKVKDTLLLFSALNCFSGGVVLGVALSHMLPDAQSNFDCFWDSYHEHLVVVPLRVQKYPFPALIATFGLIILICIDRTLLGDSHSHSEVHVENGESDLVVNNSTQTSYPRLNNSESLNKQVDHYSIRGSPTNSAIKKAWIFLAALSVHSILEGLGIGAENQKAAFYSVMLAVFAHKCLEAFALGLSIYYANFTPLVTTALVLGYSLATPFGIGCGVSIYCMKFVHLTKDWRTDFC